MDPLSGSSIAEAAGVQPAVWYDVIMNQPLQLQLAVPAVQVSAAPPTHSHSSIPGPSLSPSPISPQTAVPGIVSVTPFKGKKVKKDPSETPPKNFCCEQCGTAFTSGSNLRSHMKIHSGIKPFQCKTCGKSFLQSSNLKAHMRVHTGERPYKCSECGQTFSRSSHLVGHKRTHTGERPYICGICGDAFYTSSHLRNHVRRHTGEKAYICKHCGEAFDQSVELRVHVRYHTGEKPYKCNECDSHFVSVRERKKHQRVVHFGSRPFKCDKCERTFRMPKFLEKHRSSCIGPRPVRPKGRPRKHPRTDSEESSLKKDKNPKYRKPAAPTDRVSRSKTRAMQKAQMKEKKEETHIINLENPKENLDKIIDKQENLNKITSDKQVKRVFSSHLSEKSDTGLPNSIIPPSLPPQPQPQQSLVESDYMLKRELQPEFIPVVSESSLKDEMVEETNSLDIDPPLKHEVLSDEHISQLPMVQVMLDNFTSGTDSMVLHSLSNSTLHALQALSGHQEQLGVMDLSGQQIHDEEDVEDVHPSISILPVQQHEHSISAVVTDHQPSISNHRHSDNIVTGNQQPLVVSAHQHSVSASVSNSHIASSLPMATTAHQQAVSSIIGQLTSHHQTTSTQQLANTVPAHQHLPPMGSTIHMSSPAVTAHHNLSLVTTHQNTHSSFHQQQLPVLGANHNLLNLGLQQQSNTTVNLENTVTAHQNLSVANPHQPITTVASGHHQFLPVVSAHQNQVSILSGQQLNSATHTQLSAGENQIHPISCHQQLPIASAHEQTDAHQQLLNMNSRQCLSSIMAAHQGTNGLQQQQQHLIAVTAHKNLGSDSQQQQLPIVTAHQHVSINSSQQLAAAHQTNGTALCENLQPQILPLMSVYKHTGNLLTTEEEEEEDDDDTSQMVLEGGQTFVVDLSSPALSPQVSMVNQTISSTYTKQ